MMSCILYMDKKYNKNIIFILHNEIENLWTKSQISVEK